MPSLNKVMLIGHLGQDPQMRSTEQGQQLATFSVATNETWTDARGERQERTDWHRVVVWGKQAETCGKYLAKGRAVYVEGQLRTRSYEKDGQKQSTTEIVAQRVQFLDGRGGRETGGDDGVRDEELPF